MQFNFPIGFRSRTDNRELAIMNTKRLFQPAFRMGAWTLVALLVTFTVPVQAASVDATRPAQTIAHMLHYLGVDYPEFVRDGKVLDEAEYQ